MDRWVDFWLDTRSESVTVVALKAIIGTLLTGALVLLPVVLLFALVEG